MSPKERCPRCGKKRLFHEEEIKGARKGKVVCMDCALEQGFDEFLGEILAGKHPGLAKQLEREFLDNDE